MTALSACLASAALLSAAAGAAPSVQVVPSGSAARLLVHGKIITIFRTPNGSLSPADRAERAADRLRRLVAAGLSSSQVEIRQRDHGWDLLAAGELVMVATRAEAGQRREDPRDTATRWAQNLRRVLAPGPASAAAETPASKSGGGRPSIQGAKRTAKDDSPIAIEGLEAAPGPPTLSVPLGETRRVAIGGAAQGAIRLKTEGAGAASVSLAAGKPALLVRGTGAGKTVVHVFRGGEEAVFTAWVRQYAGRIAKAADGRVTGVTAPAALVERVALAQALEAAQCEPGATARIAGKPEGLKPLRRGETLTLAVPLTITGEGYSPLKAAARVQVTNQALSPEPAHTLLYSNDPESIREYGTLFEGYVSDEGPVRLLYHHQNRMGRATVFQVYLVNPNAAAVDVQVVEGRAGPHLEPMQCGHRAGQLYLAAASQDTGTIMRIAPREARAVYVDTVPHPETVSGIYSFRILQGGPLVAQISAAAEPTAPAVRDDMLATAQEEPHTYPSPQKNERYQYTVGSQWAFIHLGRNPIVGKSPNRKLFGNYGVLYNIDVDVSNPTAEEKTVRVMMAPQAGWARGVFMIEGKLVEGPQLAPPAEAVLWSAKLAPGERRRVNIQSMPVGGSAYPVSLVVRS